MDGTHISYGVMHLHRNNPLTPEDDGHIVEPINVQRVAHRRILTVRSMEEKDLETFVDFVVPRGSVIGGKFLVFGLNENNGVIEIDIEFWFVSEPWNRE